jgi:hypothetical protein
MRAPSSRELLPTARGRRDAYCPRAVAGRRLPVNDVHCRGRRLPADRPKAFDQLRQVSGRAEWSELRSRSETYWRNGRNPPKARPLHLQQCAGGNIERLVFTQSRRTRRGSRLVMLTASPTLGRSSQIAAPRPIDRHGGRTQSRCQATALSQQVPTTIGEGISTSPGTAARRRPRTSISSQTRELTRRS